MAPVLLPVVLLVFILGAVFLALALITFAVGGTHSTVRIASFREIERALQGSGLHICHTDDTPLVRFPGSAENREYVVALDCETGARADVLVERFRRRAQRDAAVQSLEVLLRPRRSAATYSYATYSVYVTADGDRDVRARVDAALHRLGAR